MQIIRRRIAELSRPKILTMFRRHIFALFLFWFVVHARQKSENLKICVVGNPKSKHTHTTKYCDLLKKSKRTPVECIYQTDRVECLWSVSRRKADFAVFDPEDLYFSTLTEGASILVVSEIKSLKNNSFHYGTVVVVRKDSNITGLGDLPGKKLCHPGVESGPEWTHLFAEYFEERVAPPNCEEGLTVYEDRIKTTSNYFGYACKAGSWSMNPFEDERLKKKYWNLCALCDTGDCRNTEKYRGSGGSITCLKDGVGDILWARYEDVKIHLKVPEGSDDTKSDFMFLCDDGSLMPISSQKPCFWLAQPWEVIAAHPKSATEVQKIIESLVDNEQTDWKENLVHVIELYLQYIQNLMVSKTPEDYLRKIPGYLSASALSEGNCKPKHTVKLCVSSIVEQVKCIWMSKAASALGIQPSLECQQKANITDCLNSVALMETDVVVVPPDYLHDAITQYNLDPFLMEIGNHFNNSYLVSAVVKKNSYMKKIQDLERKNVCFSRKHGIGWKTAVAILRQKQLLDSECEDHEGLTKFFKNICVVNNHIDEEENLATCCPELLDMESDETVMLSCLKKNGCDVAFLDFNIFAENSDEKKSENLVLDDFRTICRSEKAAECYWMWSYRNYLMINTQNNASKKEEAFNLFFQLGQYFGKNSKKSNSMFKIFGPFNQATNILFKDASVSFISTDRWNHTNNYKRTLDGMMKCSASSPLYISKLSIVFIAILHFLFHCM